VETQPFTLAPGKRVALSFIFGVVLLDVIGLTMLMPVEWVCAGCGERL
jgi:hypothetical protein